MGAAAGVGIHLIDLGLVARVPRLRAIRALPQLPQLGDHIAFGFTVGLVLDGSTPSEQAPRPARHRRLAHRSGSGDVFEGLGVVAGHGLPRLGRAPLGHQPGDGEGHPRRRPRPGPGSS